MYLVDTNVLSEIRRRHRAHPNVLKWAESVHIRDLFLSVITILEIETGVLMVRRRDEKQGVILRSWIDESVLPAFKGRILSVDVAVAQCCAGLHVPDPRTERDALIAATALVHGMKLVTRNIKDFRPMGVDLVNPWD
jgi:predicted nucleic acid-binding protein